MNTKSLFYSIFVRRESANIPLAVAVDYDWVPSSCRTKMKGEEGVVAVAWLDGQSLPKNAPSHCEHFFSVHID
jgi:hypothetical protein